MRARSLRSTRGEWYELQVHAGFPTVLRPCAQRANLNGRVQDVLKTQLNVTLPEFKTPDMLANLTIFGISSNKTERLGVRLRKQGFRAKHPIILVPGEGLSTCSKVIEATKHMQPGRPTFEATVASRPGSWHRRSLNPKP